MKADVKVTQLFIDSMVGIPKFSYPSRTGGKRPAKEFAHVSMIEEYQESIPAQTIHVQDSTTTTYHITSLARVRMRVAIIDTDGVAASKVMHGWTSEASKALMFSTGYGFIKCSTISLEDAKLEKEWETRQGFAVEFYVVRTFEEIVDNITSVTISGEFITPALETIPLEIIVN